MKQVKLRADPKIVEAFKMSCLASGVSMSGELSRFMAERADVLKCPVEKNAKRINSRGGRRKEVASIILRLEQILGAEGTYQSRIPENLQNGPAYESSEQSIDNLEQTIDLLREAY